ncbi:hypothetical protein PR048_031922 [Dryococelus australis]|uniref:Uncharacterized protein n=1 Tax=Dryococelus australis TaxID=614101 RepID=A0ABQ9G788_9NEOP|nr:hypothetical protein PR048_031922 [Dryococelus australis]
MGADIENFIGTCDVCVFLSCNSKKESLLSYPLSVRPWERVGCDLFPFGGHHYLVCYDDFSNWIEVGSVDNSSSSSVISKLTFIFARLGVPDALVSHSIPFGIYELANFSKEWNFKLVLIGRRHTEKWFGIAKNILRISYKSGHDVSYALLEYRNTAIAQVGLSPAQIMLGSILKSKLPCVVDQLLPVAINYSWL